MFRHRAYLLAFILFFSVLLISGCSALNPELNIDLDNESLEQTAEAFVQATASVPSTPIPLQTYEATITKNPTTIPTDTPTITPTPSNTPTITPTPGIHALMAGDVNCRTGPTSHYDWVSLITSGTSVTLLGRDRDNVYWYIQDPDGEGNCWIWNYYSTPEAQTDQLPVFTPPPTKVPTRTPRKTSQPSFSLKFEGVIDCSGQESIIVRVYNSTSRPYIFWRAQVFNVPAGDRQTEVTSSQFSHAVDECRQTIGTLSYRQTAYAVIPFDISQSGEFLIEFEACSDETEVRDCAFGGFRFTTLSLTPTATSTPTATNTATTPP